MSKQNESWGNKEVVEFLTLSNNALIIENQRLKDKIEALINRVEVTDAELVSNHYYEFMNNFNYKLKK
jgi:hypothetical protein